MWLPCECRWGGVAEPPPASHPSHGVTWDRLFGGMVPDQRLLNLPNLIDLEWGKCLKTQISRLFPWILTPPIWCSTSEFALLRSPPWDFASPKVVDLRSLTGCEQCGWPGPGQKQKRFLGQSRGCSGFSKVPQALSPSGVKTPPTAPMLRGTCSFPAPPIGCFRGSPGLSAPSLGLLYIPGPAPAGSKLLDGLVPDLPLLLLSSGHFVPLLI